MSIKHLALLAFFLYATNVSATVDTITLESLFNLSYNDFMTKYGGDSVDKSLGQNRNEMVSTRNKLLTLDSMYLYNRNICATSIVLQYNNLQLETVKFSLNVDGQKYFMEHFTQGVISRFCSKRKFRKIKDTNSFYWYKWDDLPGKNGESAIFAYTVCRKNAKRSR